MIYTFTHGVTERCESKHLSTCPNKIHMTIKEICVFDSSISSTDYLTQLRLRLGRVNVSDETRKGKRKSLLFLSVSVTGLLHDKTAISNPRISFQLTTWKARVVLSLP